MHSLSHFWRTSRRIYHPRNFSENKRAFAFFIHSAANRKMMEEFYTFFDNYPPLTDFIGKERDFQEVMTRVFLFKNSSMRDRLTAVIHHFNIAQILFSDETLQDLYFGKGITLWKSEDENLPLDLHLQFLTGQRKEGFLTMMLRYEGEKVYQFNFRFDYNADGHISLYVGTLQGTPHGLKTTKILTKKLFGYRPKNMILYFMRIFIQTLGMEDFYVITDEGFYTNSHIIRGNRSKKTFFNDFWLDEGAAADPYEKFFFRMPIEEKRRTYNEIKSQKRNLFRKRYFLMDKIMPAYIQVIYSMLRPGFMPTPSAIDAALTEKAADYDPIDAPKE
ncbi:DUF535 family protein [Megasphaera paucivorans]|uniref:DUF535 domain-containing protein n=1 Tax=Megasphaera paucivorans TaxID=349095 RepID=A0A1G9Q7R3_9FIRM|nr:DUF535 family protein [Megasphaera paucivorans]SDM07056.1 hypothetical protein SAMN05660299_00139 [Megasphaera paucivorans]